VKDKYYEIVVDSGDGGLFLHLVGGAWSQLGCAAAHGRRCRAALFSLAVSSTGRQAAKQKKEKASSGDGC
jgi:hypothetical protein